MLLDVSNNTSALISKLLLRLLIPSPSTVLTVILVYPPPHTLNCTELAVDDTSSTTPSLPSVPLPSLSDDTNNLLVSQVLAVILIISPT